MSSQSIMQDIEQIFTDTYPKSIHDAVRYGYQYRKKSETAGKYLHFSLSEPSSILLWIAGTVASGIAYDVIKATCARIFIYLREKNKKVDEETETVISDEESLKEFTVFIDEYYTHSMRITEQQEKYIKEEVAADTAAEESCRIRKETNRIILTTEEYMHITKVAYARADELIKRKSSVSQDDTLRDHSITHNP